MTLHWMTTVIWLLPIALPLSWWFGYRGGKIVAKRNKQDLHPEYFKGLNYVINEQPDKAIEVFARMLEMDTETVETHFALGNLFRRRGEVDRAIRIHKNLIDKSALSEEQHSLALFELAMDYMRSGLLDRAEDLFSELAKAGIYLNESLNGLLEIYQQEKDWDKAIVTAKKLEKSLDQSLSGMIAQFYCEQAEELRDKGDIKSTKYVLKTAINIDPNCVRANIIKAEILIKENNIEEALKAYRQIENQNPEYLTEIIEPMFKCYNDIDDINEYKKYLYSLVNKYSSEPAMVMLVKIISEQKKSGELIEFIKSELEKNPTLQGADLLLGHIFLEINEKSFDELSIIKSVIKKLLKDRAIYKCGYCGFDAKLLHWHCPGCKKWSTIKPLH